MVCHLVTTLNLRGKSEKNAGWTDVGSFTRICSLDCGCVGDEKNNSGLKIRWDRRSLREFGEAPIENYIDRYDLIIVDHPFVGFAAAHEVLVELAPFLSETDKSRFAADSVGPSWESYWYRGGLWALPIDAATQVASCLPDLMEELDSPIPRTLDEVLNLGTKARKAGKWIIVPACSTDAISMFSTSAGLRATSIAEESDLFVEVAVGQAVLSRLHALISTAHPRSRRLEPNPGLRFHDLDIGCGLLPVWIWLLQLFT